MCVSKQFQSGILDRASDNNHPLNYRSKEILYPVSDDFLKNTEDSRTPYFESTDEAMGVSRATAARIRRKKP